MLIFLQIILRAFHYLKKMAIVKLGQKKIGYFIIINLMMKYYFKKF